MDYFSNNLIKLRKQNNYTQDDLADKLNVSRQSVYKWESGQSYPDTAKIIELAKLFSVKIDDLINTDLNFITNEGDSINRPSINKEEYERNYRVQKRNMAMAVTIILLAVTQFIFSLGVIQNDEEIFHNTISIASFIGMLVFIFTGVLLIVYTSNKLEILEGKRNNYDYYSSEEKQLAKNKEIIKLIAGLGLIFIGIIAVVYISILDNVSDQYTYYSVTFLLLMISIAVYCFIDYGMSIDMYDIKPNQEKESKLAGIVMPIAVIIYFVISFVYNSWSISWIVFPIAAMIKHIIIRIED